MSNTYDVGDLIVLSAEMTRKDTGELTDPTAVELKIKSPSGVTTTYTYALGQVLKDSVGKYHMDYELTASGKWFYKFTATGNAVGAGESDFFVRYSEFA